MLQVTHNRQCNVACSYAVLTMEYMEHVLVNQDVLHCQSTTLHVRTRSAIQYSQLRRFRCGRYLTVFWPYAQKWQFQFRQSLQPASAICGKVSRISVEQYQKLCFRKKVKTALYWPCPILCSISTVIIWAAVTALTEPCMSCLPECSLRLLMLRIYDWIRIWWWCWWPFLLYSTAGCITSSYHMSTKHAHLQRHMHFNHTNHKNRQPSSLNQIYTLHNLNGMLFISERNSITMTYQPQN